MKAVFVGILLALAAALIGALPAVVHAQDDADPEAIAQAMIDALIAGDYDASAADFDETMQEAMPAELMRQTWETLEAQVGPYQSQLGVTSQQAEGYTVFVFSLQFESAVIDVQVTISEANQIAGLYFRLGEAPQPDWDPPAYADPASYTEREIVLNEGTEWALPGTLLVPQGEGPFPAVVLVHGSGPNDRDETIGPNKPFADLATGLASQGIAVLRYDKRTLVHGKAVAQLDDYTMQEETVDDALAAVALLRETDGIDPARVFVLGHSQGGYLAPRIGAADPALAGLIVMAGNTRPLITLYREQVEHLLTLDGALSADDEEQLAQVDEVLVATRNVQPGDDPATLLFNAPASYWLDLQDYDPAALAQTLDLPMLILQGERDYQVTLDDFTGWQDALGNREDVAFETYPELNHLFLAGEGVASPEEYGQPSHIPQAVIDDIATWVTSQAPSQ